MFWMQSSCVHSYSDPPVCSGPCSLCWKNGEPDSNSCLRSVCLTVIWCVLVFLYCIQTWPVSFRLTLASGPSPFPSTVRVSDSQPASALPGWPPLSPILKSLHSWYSCAAARPYAQETGIIPSKHLSPEWEISWKPRTQSRLHLVQTTQATQVTGKLLWKSSRPDK